MYFPPAQVGIIKVLMLRRERVVSKADIADLVWGRQISSNLIAVNVSHIRGYVNKMESPPFRISTLRNAGYRLTLADRK